MVNSNNSLNNSSLPEKWDSINEIYAQIMTVDDDHILCKCLIDEFSKIFEEREFEKKYFKDFTIQPGSYVLIKFFKKIGTLQISFNELEKSEYLVQKFRSTSIWEEMIKVFPNSL